MLIDYHTHHYRCGHAVGELKEYIEKAIILGLDQIGLSDHMPVIHLSNDKILPGLAMDRYELEEYVKEVLNLKKEYKSDIDVKLGIEADYIRNYEDEIEKLLSPYSFDYILGSVHFLGDWDFSDSRQISGWRKKPIDDIFKEYYYTIQKLVKSELYDIIGHFDVIKKYGHTPRTDMWPLINETLDIVKKYDMTMEINTSGLSRPIKEIYPSPKIVEAAVNKGIYFTLGSDAHAPENVHLDLEKGRKVLENLGVNKLATYNQRDRVLVDF